MPNFAQNSVVISSMATKKYIWAYFRRKSMDLGPKKYTSRIEVPCPTPVERLLICFKPPLKTSLKDARNTLETSLNFF